MPYGDGTGPDGMGPRTGRGLGYCSGYNGPGFRRGTPLRRRFGLRGGWGFRWRFASQPQEYTQPISKEEEKRILEEEVKNLEDELRELKKRLEEFN